MKTFKEVLAQIDEEIRHWPQSMKRHAGLKYNPDVDPNWSDVEVELRAREAPTVIYGKEGTTAGGRDR